MPDTLVGATIKAGDFPRAVWMQDSTALANLANTAYAAGSPDLAFTFVAPTSGQALLTVGAGMRDNGGTNRVHFAPQVRQDSAAGAIVLAADVGSRGVGSGSASADYQYHSRTTLLQGLTPGRTYHVQGLHKVSGGTSADIGVREMIVCPLPLGGNWAGQPIKALDYPPAVWAQDSTQINNPANTGYILGTPEVSVTFIAPTSGRVLLVVGGGLGNSAGSDRIFLSPEVRLTNSAGAVIVQASVTERGYGSQNQAAAFHYGSRESVLDGLTPGQQYWAAVKYVRIDDPAGTTTADIAVREILVAPLP